MKQTVRESDDTLAVTDRHLLLTEAQQRTRALMVQAERYFHISLPTTEIRFDLFARAAGMVILSSRREACIRYNPVLLANNRPHFLNQTLPHEVAHLVAHTLYGSAIRPHGTEWKGIMNFFGAEPVRCHNYTTDNDPSRRLRRFNYSCGCQQHQLTVIRHNRILQGQQYICRHCGELLQFVDHSADPSNFC